MAVVRTLIGNVRGPQGADGSSFEYAKTYASIAAMNSDFSGTDTATGDYVIISSASPEDPDNGKMYRKGNSAWIYVSNLRGPTGATGPAGPLCPLDTSMSVTLPGQAALDAALGPTLAGKLDATGDSKDNKVTYTSDDVADGSASAWETVQPLTSEEKHESLFAKISKVVKNVRFLYKLLGTTDISAIGSGTVTDILSALNSGKFDKANVLNNLTTTTAGYALDAREGKTLADNVSALNDALGTTNTNLNNTVMNRDAVKVVMGYETSSFGAPEGTCSTYVSGASTQKPASAVSYGNLFQMRSPFSVHPSTSGAVYSQIFVDTGANMYVRAFNNGGWTAWKKVTTTNV